jgi:16S rRNA C1402 N4-methylase RsmH
MIKYKEVEWGLLEKAHEMIESSVGVGDMVVDATLGNGHDTLFLAQCVGPTGKVIGFDVQQAALDATRKRLLVAGIGESSFELHLESHVQILEYVPFGVSAVVFNLGYLPGADKSVITQVATTLEALT